MFPLSCRSFSRNRFNEQTIKRTSIKLRDRTVFDDFKQVLTERNIFLLESMHTESIDDLPERHIVGVTVLVVTAT